MEHFPEAPEVGTRVRLVHCGDECTRLEPGTLGTVRFVDDMGTVHVDWDDGSRLGLVAQYGDAFEIVAAEATGQSDPQPAAGPTASGGGEPPRVSDSRALDHIAELLRAPDWSGLDMLMQISGIVALTGRVLDDPRTAGSDAAHETRARTSTEVPHPSTRLDLGSGPGVGL